MIGQKLKPGVQPNASDEEMMLQRCYASPSVAPGDLLAALGNGQLSVLFQPKCECGSQRVVGAEALTRWQHPQHGPIPPATFIELAERCGLISVLGNWVLDRSCEQLRRWRDQGNMNWSIAVNVSPLQLQQPEFYRQVLQVLMLHQIPAECLVLEINESAMMQSLGLCREQLVELSRAGVRISLDDFGRGFSSLALLKNLPVNEVKIDMLFVTDVDRNNVDPSIVSTIVTLAAIHGMSVVAEGVERDEQLRVIELLGCDQTQGFLHTPPIAGDHFLKRYGQQDRQESAGPCLAQAVAGYC